jgi:hypothetical protein
MPIYGVGSCLVNACASDRPALPQRPRLSLKVTPARSHTESPCQRRESCLESLRWVCSLAKSGAGSRFAVNRCIVHVSEEDKPVNSLSPLWVWIVASGMLVPCLASAAGTGQPIVFATFAEDSNSLRNVLLMAESIRTFGGKYKDAPIWAYMPAALVDEEAETLEGFVRLNVDVRTSEAPQAAMWFYFAAKVFASAKAEAEAKGVADILAWLDEDTIVLQEPGEFLLPKGKSLGYRPVMHKNIGLHHAEPVDAFWGRAFELLSVPETSLFPMVTPADGDTIRPYFNAGCLVVRPERGLMAKWAECFTTLYRDSLMTEMCKADPKKRIFIHQVALAGAVLTHLERAEMIEFSSRINYPIFFEQMFGAKRVFDDITGVVTFRHESYFRKPAPDWDKTLKGPADRITWIKEHLETEESR